MKNKKVLLMIVLIAIIMCNFNVFSQSSSSGPVWPNTPSGPPYPSFDYLGWTFGSNALLAPGGSATPELIIKNEDPMPISFYTNAGAGGFANLRMWIKEDGGLTANSLGFPNDGFIGIGDFNVAGFAPQNQVHIHTNAIGNTSGQWLQFTNGNCTVAGGSVASGFRVGITANNTPPVAQLRQEEIAPMLFFKRIGNVGVGNQQIFERIRITDRAQAVFPFNPGAVALQVTGVTVTRGPLMYNASSINTFAVPVATFNIGANPPTGLNNAVWAGNRPWMDVGTYNNFQSDNMYIGLKDEGPDIIDREADAIINWGDNLTANPVTEDIQNLRFIFTAPGVAGNVWTAGPQNALHGLEVARMTSNGYLGIGDFYLNGPAANVIAPCRRLEILDETNLFNNYPTISLNQPQFRITLTQAANFLAPLNTGTWTDFQTNLNPPGVVAPLFVPTGITNLYIHPCSDNLAAGFPRNGRVGINIAQAGNTLEINAIGNQFGDAVPPTVSGLGTSGLRFNDMLACISTASANPWDACSPPQPHLVLTVDQFGDVILVPDDDGGSSITCPGGINFITKYVGSTQICRSAIWENDPSFGNRNVGIGTTVPAYQLNVIGSSMFSDMTGVIPTDNACTSFSLGVKSVNTGCGDGMGFGGLAIFSDEGFQSDRLHIFSDGQGFTHLVTNEKSTVFYDRHYEDSHLGFYPPYGTTVIKDDFHVNPVPPYDDSKLYVEAQFDPAYHHYSSIHINAIHGNNNLDETKENLSGWETVGVRGDCFRIRQREEVSNTGGYFWAEGASENGLNRGLKALATGIDHAKYNIGADVWVAPAPYNDVDGSGSVPINIGVHSRVFYGNSAASNVGGYFRAENGYSNHGVDGFVGNDATLNYGGVFQAYNGIKENVGVKCVAQGGATLNLAVWGVSSLNNCPTTALCTPWPCITAGGCTQAAGFFNGQVYSSMGYWTASDELLKDSLTVLTPLDTSVTNSIHTYAYKYNTASYPTMGLPGGNHYGFIAEEVGAVFPNMVTQFQQPAEYDSSGNIIKDAVDFLAVNYQEFIPLVWDQNKSLKQTIDILEQRLTTLEQTISSCCNMRIENPNTNTGSIELENLKSIQLEQNDPNPFSENSIIRWSIPTDFKEAFLLFFENSGSQINKYKIEQKGNGELQVFGSKLSSGVYTYTLVVDGKIIDSKKMMKAK